MWGCVSEALNIYRNGTKGVNTNPTVSQSVSQLFEFITSLTPRGGGPEEAQNKFKSMWVHLGTLLKPLEAPWVPLWSHGALHMWGCALGALKYR